MENTEKDITKTEKLYSDLNNLINNIPKRKEILIAGDFNAKTGSSNKLYPENLGIYGKGLTNQNGEFLLNFCSRNNLCLTNTFFKHKLCNITTWESPDYKNKKHRDGTVRRNPYRNQIDYIITKKGF